MWTEMSDPAILIKLGARIKDTRIRKGITQVELAIAAGVSPLTVANIEKGKSVTTVLFLGVLRVLGLLENLENLIPEAKISPLHLKKIQGKKRYRVRRFNTKKDE
ncbi:helix-turn-helix transcriptional regulator [Bacteroides ovatus]|uniref:helix-turn-helix transcriptional regulator n=1 Tax=Bacteroides ovatus TaxID=28116 RepID=UPI00189EE30E|nr:helix-turn-helix transcriptional regulator [Bacteroides ovatus]